jgi:hypothetical protein
MKRSPVTAKPVPAKRRPVLLLTLGTAIAFVAGGSLAYGWLAWQQRPLLSSANVPVGAEVIPQTAVVTLSLSTDERQWQRLRTFGTPASQELFDSRLAVWRDRLLTANGLDYQRDVAPWVGDTVTIGFLSSEASAAAAAEAQENPNVLLVMPIEDPAQAQQTLGARASELGQVTEREYNGVTIRETAGENPMAIAVLNNSLLVIAPTGAAVEQAIDTQGGEDSVAQTPGYRQSLSLITVQDQPFLQAYVNLPATRDAAEETTSNLPISGESFPESRGLAATVTVEAEGVRLQTVTWIDPDSKTRLETSNSAEQMPSLLPANTLAMLSGSNFREAWAAYGQQSQMSASSPLNPDNIRKGVQNTLGLNIDQDLLPWMNGEFALALASGGAGTGTDNLNVMLLAEAGDRTAAETSMQQIESALTSRYQYSADAQDLNGNVVKALTAPSGALSVRQGWLDRGLAFWSLSAPGATPVLPAATETSLATSNPLFVAATSQAPTNNAGYFFVDTERLFNGQSSFPIPALPPSVSSYLQAIRAIGVTARSEGDRAMLYDISVVLKKAGNPGALPAPGTATPDAAPETEVLE